MLKQVYPFSSRLHRICWRIGPGRSHVSPLELQYRSLTDREPQPGTPLYRLTQILFSTDTPTGLPKSPNGKQKPESNMDQAILRLMELGRLHSPPELNQHERETFSTPNSTTDLGEH